MAAPQWDSLLELEGHSELDAYPSKSAEGFAEMKYQSGETLQVEGASPSLEVGAVLRKKGPDEPGDRRRLCLPLRV